MLNPNRLSGSWFTRKKTVKWELDRRFPVRYTASNSPLRTSRAARGNSRRPSLLGREPMASLLAARRQHLAAALRLHAHAEAVRLRATPLPRLISPLWQSTPPFIRVERSRDFTSSRANATPSASRRQPSTGRISSLFRISKCSRAPRMRSRKPRGGLQGGGKMITSRQVDV